MLKKRDILRKKAEKEQGKKKVRSAAERKRARTRREDAEMVELNKEAKLNK
jgi:hypothetical protein